MRIQPASRPVEPTAAPVAALSLLYDGWICRTLELHGDNELRARFDAAHSRDYVEVQVVSGNTAGPALRRLDHCSVRYRAHVGVLTTTERARVGALVMGTAAAVDGRLAANPRSTMAEAFGRGRTSGPVALSVHLVRDLLAPDVVLGHEIMDGWRLADVVAVASPPRAGTRTLEVVLHFAAPGERKLQVVVGRRDDRRGALVHTAHLSISHRAYDSQAMPSAGALLAWVSFLLQVRDEPTLDLVVPPAPAALLREPSGETETADGETLPDAWSEELEKLRGELRAKNIACHKPWTTLERLGSWVLPCCQRFLHDDVRQQCEPGTDSLMKAWNSTGMQEVRRAMAAGTPHDTCSEDCPIFHGDNELETKFLFERPASRAVYDNTVKVLREMIDGVTRVESVPPRVLVSVERDCNIHCVMCSVVAEGPAREEGGPILDGSGAGELVSLFPRIRSLTLSGGEPTIAPLTRELLSQLDVEHFPDSAAHMITNGLMLTPKYLDALRKTRLELVVSLNAGKAATYEAITGRRGGFERVIENVRTLLSPDADFVVRPRVLLGFVVMKDTYRELLDFFQIAQDLGTSVRLHAVYGELGGQSIFTDESLLRTVSEHLDSAVLPKVAQFPKAYGIAAHRVAEMLRYRLERRDFSPY